MILGVYHGIICGYWDLTGTLFIASMILMSIFSLPLYIRKNLFEVFYVVHLLSIIIIMIFIILHGKGTGLIGAAFWFIDLIVRYIIV